MSNRLKQIRGTAGLSQKELSAKVGVSQPTYQRWETGMSDIPKARLAKLAKELDTTPDFLLGRHPPIRADFYSEVEDDKAGYWGEAAFHFVGAGSPLLLTISDYTYPRLFEALQAGGDFLTVESMANQTVAIRRAAIKDVFLSSEAYDTYGPKGIKYPDFLEIKLPDERDWAIIEHLDFDGAYDEFPADQVDRVKESIRTSDEQLAKLVELGHYTPGQFEDAKAREAERERLYRALATETVWQFSDGERRTMTATDPEFYEGLRDLIDLDEDDDYSQKVLVLTDTPGHRVVFLNRDSIDYLSVPTHAYQAAAAENLAEEMDDLEGE